MEISNLKPTDDNNKVTLKDNFKFIIPSIIGILLFMIPIKHKGDITIPIAIFSGMLVDFLGEYLVYLITGTLAISAVFSLIATLFKPKFITNNKLLNSLKYDKEDRRRVISLWQDSELDTAVLPSCVWSSEWDVTDGKLNIWVHQRSCDVPLGLPFNVTQYAVLLMMVAQGTGLEPGAIDWSIKDAHIYVNQIDGIKEQIRRGKELEDLPAPKLWLNPEVKDFYDFDNSSDLKDIKVSEYKHHGKISFPIAQ